MFNIVEIPIESIVVTDRARQDLGDVEALMKDIETVGLLSPITVNDQMKLLAGERRLTACKQLNHETILARIIPNLSPDDELMIELIENTGREAFKWHEEINIKAKLHQYWAEQAKPAAWGYRETAAKLKVSIGGLSSDLALTEAIRAFPELKDAESKRQANDRYKKMIDQVKAIKALDNLSELDKANLSKLLNKETPAEVKEVIIPKARHADTQPEFTNTSLGSSTDEPPQETDEPISNLPEHKYAIESWQTFIPQIPDNSIGFIELDPPYAIDFNTNYGKVSNIQSTANDWTFTQLQDCFREMLPLLYDKLLDNSWVLCWTGKEHWQWINEGAAACKFKVQDPGVWVKKSGGSNTPSTTMISCYETFLLFRKGDARFNLASFPSVISFLAPSSSQRSHQWEKPLEMYNYFQKQLGKPGTLFLSPFAGSGNSMLSAAMNKMIPFGCDLEQKYIYKFYENMNNYFNRS